MRCGPAATWPAIPLPPDDDLGEVIVEFTRTGGYLRCAAVHVATGTEVVAIGPAHEPRAVERLAVAKLRKRLGL